MSTLASIFRTLNAQLLYTRGAINTLLKSTYWLSVLFFKRWRDKRLAVTMTTINNFDRDLRIQIDISKRMGAAIYWTGFHEFNEMRFLNKFLKENMTFVDVGANQGEFALFAAKRVSKGSVLAFEPMSLYFDRLVSNVSLNRLDNVKCLRLGLSDRSGEVPIYFNEDDELNNEGNASLFPQGEKEGEKEVITLATLDEMVKEHGIEKVDFIKIDVEGNEWPVLRGAEQVLRKFKPVLMVELNAETATNAGYEIGDMVSWLQSLGYNPFQMSRKGLEPLKIRPFCNAIFLAP